MKKVILGLFVLGNLCFAKWNIIELVDDFKEKTGKVSAVADTEEGWIRLDKNGKEYSFYVYPGSYIGGKGKYDTSKVKVKIDDNTALELQGYVTKDGKKVEISSDYSNKDIFPKVIEQMKKGNKIKMVIEKFNGTTILQSTDLQNFVTSYQSVK